MSPQKKQRQRSWRRQLWRMLSPVLFTLAGLWLLWILHEVAEQNYPLQHSDEFLRAAHFIRYVVGACIVAVALIWGIIRVTPPFPKGVQEAETGEAMRETEADRSRAYAGWFIGMRWIALVVSVLLILVAVGFLRQLPREVLPPLLVLVGILGASNLVYLWLIRTDQGARAVLLVQGYVDLCLLTGMLHFSGGVENPLTPIMIFHVMIGGILLSRRHCFGLALAGACLFGGLLWLEYAGLVTHYTLRVFPHQLRGEEIWHAAHEPVYVVSRLTLNCVVLFLTAYFVTSLTERLRQNERRLARVADKALASQQLLERALETTGTGLRVLDGELQPQLSNRRWDDWFAQDVATGAGPAVATQGPESHPLLSLRDGRVRVAEARLGGDNAKDAGAEAVGNVCYLQVTTAPLVDAEGQTSSIVQLAQDVTLQKTAQAQMLRAGRLAAVGELAGHVAHEVNNPAAIVIAKVKLLLTRHSMEMSPKVRLELGKVLDLTNRVAEIAKGLLSYCRPSPRARHPLDLRQCIRKSLALVSERAERQGVEVQDRLPAHSLVANANAQEIEQIFLNLFLNALDAMPQGGTLRLAALENPGLEDGRPSVTLQVEDTGCGIAPELQPRIFEPFFSTKQEGKGTGLGLSICAGLVRGHEGEITVESGPGQGTRFKIALPLSESS